MRDFQRDFTVFFFFLNQTELRFEKEMSPSISENQMKQYAKVWEGEWRAQISFTSVKFLLTNPPQHVRIARPMTMRHFSSRNDNILNISSISNDKYSFLKAVCFAKLASKQNESSYVSYFFVWYGYISMETIILFKNKRNTYSKKNRQHFFFKKNPHYFLFSFKLEKKT